MLMSEGEKLLQLHLHLQLYFSYELAFVRISKCSSSNQAPLLKQPKQRLSRSLCIITRPIDTEITFYFRSFPPKYQNHRNTIVMLSSRSGHFVPLAITGGGHS